MPRSGVDTGHATGNLIPWEYFVRFDLVSTYRYTTLPVDVTLNVDGSSQLWTSYPMQVQDLSQSSQSPLDVSSVSLANIDQSWNARAFGGTDQFREMAVLIYLVQFDPATFTSRPPVYTILGKPKMFEGRIGGADQQSDGWLKIPLNPHAASWNAISLFLIDSHCPYDYKGPECGYAGAIATCARTRDDCVTHANQARFGGSDFMPTIDVELSWGTLTATLPVVPVDNTSILKVREFWVPDRAELILPNSGGRGTVNLGGSNLGGGR